MGRASGRGWKLVPGEVPAVAGLAGRRAVVFGVATEYCVRATSLALRRRGFAVDVVADAIKAITDDGGRKALEELAAVGVRTVSTDEVCEAVQHFASAGRSLGYPRPQGSV